MADSNDEFWAYGPFDNETDAQEYLEELERKINNTVCYWVAAFYPPEKIK